MAGSLGEKKAAEMRTVHTTRAMRIFESSIPALVTSPKRLVNVTICQQVTQSTRSYLKPM